jgi:hypothetical protein
VSKHGVTPEPVRVVASFRIIRRGLALILTASIHPAPGLFRVRITKPDGASIEVEAREEYATLARPVRHEVPALIVADAAVGTVPDGSTVELLE